MTKEMQLLKSKLEYCERLIDGLVLLKFITGSNEYDKIIEEYQNRLSELYTRVQELKGE